ncbi:MAG TPA: NFACT RNA binding domain-containing protein [Vicinamibacteria bacterium]|nr:NFACT RNA binding domain-containing protein [Vicinamibacteria bacterium]
MDAVTLERTLAELRPLVVGRYLSKPRLAGGTAVAFDVRGSRDRWLWLDAGRATAGVYWLPRDVARSLAEHSPLAVPGRSRQALLHLRKHLDGARVVALARVAGERAVVLEAGDSRLTLRLGGSAPALSLVRDGAVVGSLGEGPEAWPLPESPEREWDRIDPVAFEAAVAAARAEGRSLVRAVLAACPGLGPRLARETDGSAASLVELRGRLRDAAPTLLVPGPQDTWHDADLVDPAAVTLAPIELAGAPRPSLRPSSWLEAGALFLEARRRGLEFERRRRSALDEGRRQVRRLEQLEANLAKDLAGLADEGDLRRRAGALLAFARGAEAGQESVELPDPSDPGRVLVIALDPRLGGLANAERLFDKARRVERARHQIDLRLRETRSALLPAREGEALVLDARDTRELPGRADDAGAGDRATGAGPRHYLTGRGLSVLVGRNARENHHLTFRVARAEDLWLHARDAPGAHVVLRDNEGRAGADDLREAAEVAAFFSEARGESLVDVHVTRRKHVKPAKGGPGRVFVAHSDTLRVAPRDPEGRLRKR